MTVRWALLGTGRHAERSVVGSLKQAEGSELVAVMSRDRARGEAFARTHGIARVHDSVAAMLADGKIDAIYDTTPDALHAPHAIAAAEAGKHVLVEKPLAVSVAQGLQAIDACRRRGVSLGVVFNQRHEPAHQEARRLVREGAIGDVVLAQVQIPLQSISPPPDARAWSWRTDPAMRAGGIAISIGDHAHDTLAYLIGQEVAEVSAFTDATRDSPPNESVAGLLLKLSKGAIGYAVATRITPFARRPFEIHGTKGTILIENSYLYLTGGPADATPRLTVITEAGERVQAFEPADCFRLEVERFNRAIAGKEAPMTPPDEGLRAVAIGDAIYQSVRTGSAQKIAAFLPS
jgi:1,5-anhydro-D-fructose reductase (1,5-anhydro-D-mannitol-forming)